MTDDKALQERDPTTGKISKSSPDAAARARQGKAEKERRQRAAAAVALRKGVGKAGVRMPDVASDNLV